MESERLLKEILNALKEITDRLNRIEMQGFRRPVQYVPYPYPYYVPYPYPYWDLSPGVPNTITISGGATMGGGGATMGGGGCTVWYGDGNAGNLLTDGRTDYRVNHPMGSVPSEGH